MSPLHLYQWVVTGPDLAEAVAALSDECLCRLAGFLAQDYDENEATGEALGMCLVEQARRFAVRVKARGQDVPATFGEGIS